MIKNFNTENLIALLTVFANVSYTLNKYEVYERTVVFVLSNLLSIGAKEVYVVSISNKMCTTTDFILGVCKVIVNLLFIIFRPKTCSTKHGT